MNFINHPDDKTEVTVKGAFQHIAACARTGSVLVLAERTHIRPKCADIRFVRRPFNGLHRFDDGRKKLLEGA